MHASIIGFKANKKSLVYEMLNFYVIIDVHNLLLIIAIRNNTEMLLMTTLLTKIKNGVIFYLYWFSVICWLAAIPAYRCGPCLYYSLRNKLVRITTQSRKKARKFHEEIYLLFKTPNHCLTPAIFGFLSNIKIRCLVYNNQRRYVRF